MARRSYHVFLSFRGEDTRHGFTTHLFATLREKGINTFMDDQRLQMGQPIAPELLRAIEESLFSIVVLSRDYASSTWCLDELQKIVESRRLHGREIFPVFYGVDPSDVRRQKGKFAEAFAKHEQRFQDDMEKVQRWRDALTQVANLSGWNSKDWNDAKLIEDIVHTVWKYLKPKLPSGFDMLSGADSKMQEMNMRANDGLKEYYSGEPIKFCCFSF